MLSALDELRWHAREMRRWLGAIVGDVTGELAHWRPAGRANTIATTYAHVVYNQDEDMNQGYLGRPMLAATSWRGRTGIPADWVNDDANAWKYETVYDWDAMRAYGDAVGAYVIEAVDELTDEDLLRVAKLSTPDHPVWTGLDVVRLTVGRHPAMHGGEIACLKGLQGSKGYLSGRDAFQA
jgi:hypothetical protein